MVEELIEAAYKASEYSYSPYSKFKVGAAILTNDGKVFTGCNVENSSFGATICAERTSILKAVSEGHKEFKAIAIVSNSKSFTYPCGICRQFLSEFVNDDFEIYLHDEKNGIKKYKMNEILPLAFTL